MALNLENTLDEYAIEQLAALVDELDANKEPFGKDMSTKEGKVITLDYRTSPLALKAMKYLYEHNLIIDFDWPNWQDHISFLNNPNADKYDDLDREFVLKLLTLYARKERFNEGVWANSFDSGVSQRLLKRLLDIELLNKEGS